MAETQETTAQENLTPETSPGEAQEIATGDPGEGSLLSRTASEDASGKEAEGEAEKQEDGKEEAESRKPEKPEDYELSFAKETQVDVELLDSFRKTALEIGLTKGQAQKLASQYEAHMKGANQRLQEAQTKALLDARKGWEAEICKQPGFQEDLGRIQNALRQFGDQELFDLLDQTNLGSHPKMFAFMAKVGKALAEPGFHGSAGSEAKTAAEVLYPTMNR